MNGACKVYLDKFFEIKEGSQLEVPVSHEADVVNKLFFVQFKNPERLSGSCFVTSDHAGHVNNLMV